MFQVLYIKWCLIIAFGSLLVTLSDFSLFLFWICMSGLENVICHGHGISCLLMELPSWICFRWYIFNGELVSLGSFLVSCSEFSVYLVLVLTLLTHCCFLTHTSMPMSFHPVQNHMSVTYYIVVDFQAIFIMY
jgi:hypothetical protein